MFIPTLLLGLVSLALRLDLPAPTGPGLVGTVTLQFMNYSHPDPLSPSPHPRDLMVSVFYPVQHIRRILARSCLRTPLLPISRNNDRALARSSLIRHLSSLCWRLFSPREIWPTRYHRFLPRIWPLEIGFYCYFEQFGEFGIYRYVSITRAMLRSWSIPMDERQ